MTLDPYQELTGDSVEVGLASASIILIDCDTPVPLSYIRQGVRTTVIGKYDTGNRVLRAVVVIVEPREITGHLTKIESITNSGNKLTMSRHPVYWRPYFCLMVKTFTSRVMEWSILTV